MFDDDAAPQHAANNNPQAGQPQGTGTTGPLNDSRRFAARLRWLRDSYYTRISSGLETGPTPRMHLKALAVVECLNEAGYPVSSGAYSELETGRAFPRKANDFLKAIAACLKLDDDMVRQLREDIVFDIIEERVDRKTALLVARPMTMLGAALWLFRKRIGLSEGQLAECLFNSGFRVEPRSGDKYPLFRNADELSVLIARIESSSAWPFGDQDRAPFLEACAACLGDDSAKDLSVAMIEDQLRARTGSE